MTYEGHKLDYNFADEIQYSPLEIPYVMSLWIASSYCGPALGPLISGFAVTAEGWRWSLWEILWLAGPVFLLLFFCLPETSGPNIFLRRAQRLRISTGNADIKSQSEVESAQLKFSAVLIDALMKPGEISMLDPSVMFTNLYTSLVYAIYYSFFEAFPGVYPVMYGFSVGTLGVLFLCILVACALGMGAYLSYVYFYFNPKLVRFGPGPHEERLIPALIASIFVPIGLFIFGWTANPSIPWIVSVIGIVVYSSSIFVV